jgi:hypothetical protein
MNNLNSSTNLSNAFEALLQRTNANTRPRTNLDAASMNNAGFYAGPQLGQSVPPGYANKIVS